MQSKGNFIWIKPGYDKKQNPFFQLYLLNSGDVVMPFDTGNTGFMLIATSLVMLMTPGLAFFYGGLVGRKNVLSIMIQSFVSMGWTTFIWWAVGYSLVFSGGEGGVLGNLNHAFLMGITPSDALSINNNIPLLVFIAYQMMFAIITPALITGAFANRVRFGPYMIFLTVWLLFVYFPVAHMVWGRRSFCYLGCTRFRPVVLQCIPQPGLQHWLQFYLSVGEKNTSNEPHNIPLVALGTALLWFGWYGFNAGSELRVDQTTALAFLNTDIAASIAAITWLGISWFTDKKPKFLGLLTGAVAGLVAITPAAGYVSITGAVIIGLLAGVVCYLAVLLKNKLHLDDALDVWGRTWCGRRIGLHLHGAFCNESLECFWRRRFVFGRHAILPHGNPQCCNNSGICFLLHFRCTLANQ